MLAITSSAATFALDADLHPITTVAPILTSSRVVSRPMPVLAPVTTHSLPPMSTGWKRGPRMCLWNVRAHAASVETRPSTCSATAVPALESKLFAAVAVAPAADRVIKHKSSVSQPTLPSVTSRVDSRHASTATG